MRDSFRMEKNIGRVMDVSNDEDAANQSWKERSVIEC